MTYCHNCGREIEENATTCAYCGAQVDNYTPFHNRINIYDSSNFGLAVLGFFFPVSGLVLYLVWKDWMPRRAKSAGKGALVGIIVKVVFSVLMSLIYLLIVAALLANRA